MRCVRRWVLACLLAIPVAAAAAPRDIIVVFVDHWEPGSGADTPDQIRDWCDSYRVFADRHRDADGRPLNHTFFYWNFETGRPWTRPQPAMLEPVLQLAFDGYGEIDLHIHHAETGTPDENRAAFTARTGAFIADGARWGLYRTCEAEPRTRFGFIHGMWALDNSRYVTVDSVQRREHCGVDRELDALRELGCYADFTFPAHSSMNPALQNAIFYARDDDRPWSYGYDGNVTPVVVGLPARDELLILEGPQTPTPSSQLLDAMTPDAFDQWVRTGVHVAGRPEWIFVKLHTHGVQQAREGVRSATSEGTSTLWGLQAETFWSHVERNYNDGVSWRVHYMSAREAYNVVRAAQDGRAGNPYDYRDYDVAPYASARIMAGGTYGLVGWRDATIVLERLAPVATAAIAVRAGFDAPSVSESSDGDSWDATDAAVTLDDGVVRIADPTPAAFYRLSGRPRRDEVVAEPAPAWSADGLSGAPNPFRGSLHLSYRLGAAGSARIEVFDLRGRRVRTLLDGPLTQASGVVAWDGRDDAARLAPAGIYLCRMTTARGTVRRSVTLVR